MSEQYYALFLDDPATPSFCSFDKLYVGTRSELDIVIAVMKQDKRYTATVAAYEAYWTGSDAKHYVAFRKGPILTHVQRICSSELVLGEKEWDHINVWGFPYKMRFDRAEVKQLLIKHKRKFHRLLRATFTNLCYENTIGKWTPVIDHFWGHGCLLDIQESPDGSFSLNILLYMEQDQFDRASDADELMFDPNKVFFDRICDEIFADG